jgi:hypothetical protein
MAIIEYDTPPTGPSELGPGSVRRQYRSGLYSWTGWNNPAPSMLCRIAFADMMYLAQQDWWLNLSTAAKATWYTNSDRVHHSRPGNAGTNTGRQPFSRWVTTVAPLTYHYFPNPTLAATPLRATSTDLTITAYDHAQKKIRVNITIDSPYSQPPPIAYDFYQLRPIGGLPYLSWHSFTWIARVTNVSAGSHTYTNWIKLRHWQPPKSLISLWGRLRNGQDANDYDEVFWQT